MDANQYKADLQKYDAFSEQNMKDLAQWAEQQALPWLWAEIAGILGKKVVPLQPRDAIRQGLQTTYADREKMPREPNFYVAQMTMLDSETKRYCGAITRLIAVDLAQRFASNATIYTLHGALKACLSHGIILLEQAGHILLTLPYAYGAWSRRIETPFEIFKGAEQIVYGRFSGLTHDDRAPFTPVAVLRTGIEIRVRSAFGIQGYRDLTNNSFVPIDLGQVFEEIRKHLSTVEFAVDFHDIVKIYRWSNFYLHGGWRDFVWVPGYALQYLRPLFADSRSTPTGGWALDGGIRMPRATWRNIRNSFEPLVPTSPMRIPLELWEAMRGVLQRRKKTRRLVLNDAEERGAACVFLD